jgi:hypothetical protein
VTRVVITGDREWGEDRYGEVLNALARLDPNPGGDFVVLGDARGVDTLARAALVELGFSEGRNYRIHYAEWGRYRGGAGPIRNTAMLDDGGPDAEVWYFHDDLSRSKGTANCVEQANERGLVVRAAGEGYEPSRRAIG